MTLDEIIQKAADEPFARVDINAACRDCGLTVAELCDAISRRIASGYASGELTFLFCDGVMNHLFSFMTVTHDEAPPPYTWSVFAAFDEGEYTHPSDPPGSSAEELYTKPMIAKLLADDHQIT